MRRINNTTKNIKESIDLLETMSNIVNVRHFESRSIPIKTLNLLFEAFSLGPSLANQQPWEIIEIEQEEVRKIVKATLDPFLTVGTTGGQSWLSSSPHVYLIINDLRRAEARIGQVGQVFSTQDTFAALQNLRIYAQIEGVGTSVVREFDTDLLKKELKIPDAYSPVAILAMGYSIDEPEIPPRFTFHEILHKGGVED
ncbi:nitroreductase family protein [Paenisporosarcina sp. TG20]|uniref:nitroreductase family protein n=1 Tax=Paenisporosarcina sp. TG20 TaxID=1211706 RepID=UPI00030E9F07|nr:nitroreductase family protein [Paenisporosarcina sp. TG20]